MNNLIVTTSFSINFLPLRELTDIRLNIIQDIYKESDHDLRNKLTLWFY